MLKKLAFLALTAGLLPATNLFAQERLCGSYEAMEELARQNPGYAKMLAEVEQQNQIISEDAALKLSQTNYTIPVVVHIVHDYGGSYITREQVLDAIRILNEDFNKQNADTGQVISAFQSIYANVGITFKLAQLDPNGNCTDGITRLYTPLTNSAGTEVKNMRRWDPSKYLNIWVANSMYNGSGGFSFLPCPSSTVDGVMVRNAQFGSIGTSSGNGLSARTITHEVGHYLGLPHTWGGSNTPGLATNCSIDDGITDTPNTVGVTGQNCNTNANSCNTLNNVQNFMDYANCPKMFTLGQKAVMLNSLVTKSCRMNLWTQANLAATGTSDGFTASLCAPIADFSANRTRVCAGSTVAFKDLAYNAPVSGRTWLFPGGTPATSTDSLPLVTYNTPGIYEVTMISANAAGTDTLTKTQYIEVLSTATGLAAPFSESFESATFPVVPGDEVKNWEIENETTNTWHRTDIGVEADGSNSMRIRHGFIGEDRVNNLISPNIDLTGVTQPTLSFKIAYALPPNTTTSGDRLRVYISTDCGQNWTLRMAKTGATLATTSTLNSQFEPVDADDWRTESTTLPSSATQVMIKFESTSGVGNTLYLDAVNINGNLVGLSEEVNQLGLQVYPNPNHGQALITYELPQAEQTTLTLVNTLGQQVASINRMEQAGKQEYQLENLTGKLAAGVYYIRLQTSAKVSIQKLVIR